MAPVVHLHPALGFVIAVQAGAHGHQVHVPAILGIGQGPVGAQVVAIETDLARAAALEALGKAFDVTLQAALADEQAQALNLPAIGLPGVKVMTDLIALDRAVETRRYRAAPALVEVTAVHPAPACRNRTGFAQQALFALAVMEGAQGLQGQQLRSRHHNRIHRYFEAIQRDRSGPGDCRWQRRGGGGRFR